ncbi:MULTISPECIES: ribonuclease E/G [unclassified Fusibacter]|uniref:ribonuclease E/G n=1 Tax=unclassified Fusibacter TaxID=2624464 RepID=UPI0010116510|nr:MULTISPECIES: ribonuclease E/G [unclassified Fusibacter]MCK8060678.1 ribonuclease E/G [Fusibacter sp. A2]NPE22868.1 hypothetical protein [Fusibacter sp. A1]RXV59937.1 hypothetical protein DWB64_13565 [Fusibacter sp. A1]
MIDHRGCFYNYIAKLDSDGLSTFLLEKVEATSEIGNIYLGRIEKKMNHKDAYFIDIGRAQNALLQGKDLRSVLYKKDSFKPGQEILVQVYKDARASKGAKVTAAPSLSSEHLVLLTDTRDVKFSNKIRDALWCDNLQSAITSCSECNYGFLVRTGAYGQSLESLLDQMKSLEDQMDKLVAYHHRIVEERLLVRKPSAFETIRQECLDRLDETHMGDDAFDTALNDLLEHRFPLKNGCELVVDELEAFTVVDVNSKRFSGEYESAERFNYEVNLSVLDSLIKVLSLRNISGMILIDFIDMNVMGQRMLIKELKRRANGLEVDIKGFTALGILEMSRRRDTPSVLELIGTDNRIGGRIELGPEMVIDLMLRQLLQIEVLDDAIVADCSVTPEVYEAMLTHSERIRTYLDGKRIFLNILKNNGKSNGFRLLSYEHVDIVEKSDKSIDLIKFI